jgi:UDP-N-acetylglucosamine 4-epimerase
VAVGEQTTLNQLIEIIKCLLAEDRPGLAKASAIYHAFRTGDVRHSFADISKAERLLGVVCTGYR